MEDNKQDAKYRWNFDMSKAPIGRPFVLIDDNYDLHIAWIDDEGELMCKDYFKIPLAFCELPEFSLL